MLAPLALGIVLQDARDLDASVKALYGTISGPAGQARDWNAFRNLFAKDAKLNVVAKGAKGSRLVALTPDDYVKNAGPYLEKNGFFESEIARRTVRYGDMASVWTTYESRAKRDDAKPFERGVNCVLYARLEGEWKIVNLTYTDETNAGPLPAEFLKGG